MEGRRAVVTRIQTALLGAVLLVATGCSHPAHSDKSQGVIAASCAALIGTPVTGDPSCFDAKGNLTATSNGLCLHNADEAAPATTNNAPVAGTRWHLIEFGKIVLIGLDGGVWKVGSFHAMASMTLGSMAAAELGCAG